MKRLPVIFLVFLALTAIAWWQSREIFAQSSTPYGGKPWSIPGIIEAEDFDLGGEGLAYHDTDSANKGGQYRPDEGVDIGNSEDGAGSQYLVDWTSSGEWLQYTVEVMHTGTYNIIIREGLVDYANGVGEFHLEMDGVDITGSLQTYQGVFWWQGYSTVTVPNVQLVEGIHKLRLVLDDDSSVGVGSFNWILFELVSPKPEPLPVVYPEPDPSNAFYVSPNGDDDDPGSISHPWKTLAKAAEMATAGKTIYVREGTYSERLIPQNSGDPDNYIVFMAYPGEFVTIDGMGVTIPQLEGLVNIGSKRFIRVSGFHVINAGAGGADGKWNMGISVQKADHIIIDNNDIDHTYSLGIDIGPASRFIVVDNNDVTDTNFGDLDDEVSIGVFWFSHDVEIKNNTVHHTKNEGIGAAAGTHDIAIHHNTVRSVGLGSQRVGIYIDAWTENQYNIDVYNNLVYDNAGQGIIAASEGGGLLDNVNIYNNVVHNSGYDWGGIGVAPWSTTSSTTHPVRNIDFVNNTVYACNGGGIVINNPEVENILIRNNVLYQSGQALNIDSSVPQSQLTIDHNLTDDPQFMDAAMNDFSLQATSPAIDAGLADGAPDFDFDGKIRPAGNGYDIGAYEYGDGEPAEKLSQTITFDALPARTLGDAPLTVSATASSGLPVTLASDTPGVCTVSGKTVTLVTAGTCTLVASQSGDNVYAAATPVTRSFVVRSPDTAKLDQIITFNKPADHTLGDPPFALSAKASSNLPVSFEGSTPLMCTVSDNTVTLVAPGDCTVVASQPGNNTYAAAPDVTRSFLVLDAPVQYHEVYLPQMSR